MASSSEDVISYQRNDQLLEFLIQKAKKAVSPYLACDLAKEFKKTVQCPEPAYFVTRVINNMRKNVPKMGNLDLETKVKLIYALRTPVKNKDLTEIRKPKDVKTVQSIVEYKKKEKENDRINEKMLRFLAEKSKTAASPIPDSQFVKEFKETLEASESSTYLQIRYQEIKKKIYESGDYEKDAKIRMMFVSGAILNESILEEFQKDVEMKVDQNMRIVSYALIDHSSDNNAIQEDPSENALIDPIIEEDREFEFVPKENKIRSSNKLSIIQFVTQKCQNADSKLNIRKLSEEFETQIGLGYSYDRFRLIIREHGNQIQLGEHNPVKNSVARHLYVLNCPLYPSFLVKLRKNATVKIDTNNRIVFYKANDGSLELNTKGDNEIIKKRATSSEHDEMMKFVINKCENANRVFDSKDLFNEFQEKHECPISLTSFRAKIKKYCWMIPQFDNLDINTKVKQLFGLGASLNEGYLKILRRNAFVRIDSLDRIIAYKANDGSLELMTEEMEKQQNEGILLDEQGEILKFVNEKCENTDNGLIMCFVFQEFKTKHNCFIQFREFKRRIIHYRQSIFKREDVDMKTKVKRMFGLRTILDEECLKKLREEAVVEVNSQNQIEEYAANDGSLIFSTKGNRPLLGNTTDSGRRGGFQNGKYLETKRGRVIRKRRWDEIFIYQDILEKKKNRFYGEGTSGPLVLKQRYFNRYSINYPYEYQDFSTGNDDFEGMPVLEKYSIGEEEIDDAMGEQEEGIAICLEQESIENQENVFEMSSRVHSEVIIEQEHDHDYSFTNVNSNGNEIEEDDELTDLEDLQEIPSTQSGVSKLFEDNDEFGNKEQESAKEDEEENHDTEEDSRNVISNQSDARSISKLIEDVDVPVKEEKEASREAEKEKDDSTASEDTQNVLNNQADLFKDGDEFETEEEEISDNEEEDDDDSTDSVDLQKIPHTPSETRNISKLSEDSFEFEKAVEKQKASEGNEEEKGDSNNLQNVPNTQADVLFEDDDESDEDDEETFYEDDSTDSENSQEVVYNQSNTRNSSLFDDEKEEDVEEWNPESNDTSNTISRLNHRNFLESIRNLMFSLNIPISQETHQKFDATFAKLDGFGTLGNKNDKITINDLHFCLTKYFLEVLKDASPSENSLRLSDVLLLFRQSIISLHLPQLSDLERSIKITIDIVYAEKRNVSLRRVQCALAIVIDKIAT